MAKSTSKSILFATARHDKKVYQHPVAVFNDTPAAKQYAALLKISHKAGQKDAVVALDPKTDLTPEGELITDYRLAITEVPYSPEPDLGDEDDTAVTEA